MSSSKILAKNILKYRHIYDVTLPELAMAARISKGLLSHIENGKGNPSLSTVDKLAKAMGMWPSDLINVPLLRKDSK